MFTPIEQKMVDLLSDGRRHTKEELHACLHDDQGPLSNIWAHLTGIRKKLPQDQALVCEVVTRHGRRLCFYRLIREEALCLVGTGT